MARQHRRHVVTYCETNGWKYLGYKVDPVEVSKDVEVFVMEERCKPFNNEASIIKSAKQRRKSINRTKRA